MISWTGTPGGSLVICEGVSCPEAFFFAGSTDGPDGATVLGGGGGNGPCCCAAIGRASTVQAIMKSVMTLNFFGSLTAILEMTARILSGLLTLSILYCTSRFDAAKTGFVART